MNHRLDQKCHGEFLVEFHIKYEIKRTYFNMMNIIMHYTENLDEQDWMFQSWESVAGI